MFLAIDPGKNIGVATFTAEGKDLKRHIFQEKEFFTFLALVHDSRKNKPDMHLTIIMEDFALRQDKALAQVGSDMPAPRMIGAVQFMASLLGSQAVIELVHPRELYSALKWSGFAKYANKRIHPPDDIAAYAHGVKFLIDKGLRRHPVLDA